MLLVGIGNIWKRDDGLGPILIERLRGLVPVGVLVQNVGIEVSSLLEVWGTFEQVVIIDATSSAVEPGTVRFFDVSEKSIPAEVFSMSTHLFSLSQTIELARVLNRLPKRLTVIGIEGASFELGNNLSAEVEDKLEIIVAKVLEIVKLLLAEDGNQS